MISVLASKFSKREKGHQGSRPDPLIGIQRLQKLLFSAKDSNTHTRTHLPMQDTYLCKGEF